MDKSLLKPLGISDLDTILFKKIEISFRFHLF